MTPPITARDAAAIQRLWQARELSDEDVDRALADLRAVVDEREEAGRILRRLVEAWAPLKEAVRDPEAWLEETNQEARRVRRAKLRASGS